MSELRVMSFNVRYANPDDGLNSWELRRELAVERIRAFTPDLLGLQECQADVHKPYLSAALPDYTFLGVPRLGPGTAGTEISAILFRSAAFDLLSERHTWISRTPDVPGSLDWGAALPRTLELAHLHHRASDLDLAFLNTHLDYVPAAALGSVGALRAEIERLPKNLRLILTGDFNAGKNSRAYHNLLARVSRRPLIDALRAAGIKPGFKTEGTFHGFGSEPQPKDIDWIIVSPNVQVSAAGVDRTAQAPRYPSDHYPIWADLEI